MKNGWIAALTSIVFATTALAPSNTDARRLGGGGSAGLQRSLPARSTPNAPPAQPATPAPQQAAPATATAPAPAAAAAAAPRRSWMGPIAGLAAGLGLAALMSHLGLGEAFGEFVMLALLALVAVVVIRMLMRRMTAAPAPRAALAGAGHGGSFGAAGQAAPDAPARAGFEPAATNHVAQAPVSTSRVADAAAVGIPADFDKAGFERIAKLIFIRMQAANDKGDLGDLRSFTTPEMFATIRLDLQERGAAAQTTDVVQIDADVIDVAEQADRQVVSVRFHGLIREERNGVATPFDEVWHLVKPLDDGASWAIAGIQQSH